MNNLPGLSCNGEAVSPAKMTLPIGKSTLLRLPEEVTNRTLANPSVAQAMLMAPATPYLLGVEVGTTNMILQGKSGKCIAIDVTVAEVSKILLDKLGVNVTGSPTSGAVTYSILSNFLTGSAGTVGVNRASGSGVNLDAEKKDSLIKILAEPNVMAIIGQEGSFLAGGRILIPVGQDGVGGLGRVNLEEKEFGVGFKFTPTVLSGGRINLRVSPKVSELSREGIGISSVNGSRSVLPLITTRRASTTVQVADGQSFAIGGLIKNNVTANIKAFPILGEILILGALFRSSDFQRDRTELVFIVTPRLVKPLPADYRLPTDGVLDPSRKDLFIDGKLERSGQPRVDDGTRGFELK